MRELTKYYITLNQLPQTYNLPTREYSYRDYRNFDSACKPVFSSLTGIFCFVCIPMMPRAIPRSGYLQAVWREMGTIENEEKMQQPRNVFACSLEFNEHKILFITCFS